MPIRVELAFEVTCLLWSAWWAARCWFAGTFGAFTVPAFAFGSCFGAFSAPPCGAFSLEGVFVAAPSGFPASSVAVKFLLAGALFGEHYR